MTSFCTIDEKYFAAVHEERRKDIEKAFEALQEKLNTIAVPSRLWAKADMTKIMYCCIIPHNVVVVDTRPLVDLSSAGDVQSTITTDSDLQNCFRQLGNQRPIVMRGPIAAMYSN